MKNDRPGDHLWDEWHGECYESYTGSETVYWTLDHVDVSIELVKRALASALQRDGVAISLGDGFKKADSAHLVYGYVGIIDEEEDLLYYFCDEEGFTKFGDVVIAPLPAVFVEL